jgi:hypothetical protein
MEKKTGKSGWSPVQWLNAMVAIGVLFLAGAAFWLSYNALCGLAAEYGIAPDLTWLWPLVVDAFMVILAVCVILSKLDRKLRETRNLPFLVFAFAILSVIFNVVATPKEQWQDLGWPTAYTDPITLVYQSLPTIGHILLISVIHALPPVVLVIAVELLSRQLEPAVKAADKEYKKAEQKVSSTTVFESTTGTAERARRGRKTKSEQVRTGLLEFYRQFPDGQRLTQEEIGARFQRSKSWVSATLKEWEETGIVDRNDGRVLVQDNGAHQAQ